MIKDQQVLLAHHLKPGAYDFWAPPGGGVEDEEELSDTAVRETFEETGIQADVKSLAYIDELIDTHGRMVKFWFLARFSSGQIDISANPARDEKIVDAGWFSQSALPKGYVFPEPLRDRFWIDLEHGFPTPVKLPLKHSVF